MTQNPARPENQTEPDDTRPRRRRVLEVSFVQLCAGALAAMTSAVIGSRLGVSGTVIGAAVGSLVAGITGSVFTASLKHGGQVISRTPIALKVAPALAVRERPTAQLPAAAAVPPGVPTRATLEHEALRARPAPRRRAWKPVLATTAAAFLLAGFGITAVELATGHSLSGREGTTISQVGGSAEGVQPPARPPAEQPTEQPTGGPVEDVSSEPTPSEDSADAQGDHPTDVPSEAPTETPSDSPAEEPDGDESGQPTEEPSSSQTQEPPEAPAPAW